MVNDGIGYYLLEQFLSSSVMFGISLICVKIIIPNYNMIFKTSSVLKKHLYNLNQISEILMFFHNAFTIFKGSCTTKALK